MAEKFHERFDIEVDIDEAKEDLQIGFLMMFLEYFYMHIFLQASMRM